MGLVAATITVLARRTEDAELASAAAIASLVIAALLTIFVVPPLARSARIEVGRVDLPFEITKGGLVFLSVLAVVAFAAWNTGNNLLFLVFSLLLSTVFVAWAAARASLRDMVVKARFPDHIFAGEPAPVIVTLRNAKRFFSSFSVLVDRKSTRLNSSHANILYAVFCLKKKKTPLTARHRHHGAHVQRLLTPYMITLTFMCSRSHLTPTLPDQILVL